MGRSKRIWRVRSWSALNASRVWTAWSECFPFQVLSVEASVREFYDFYGI